MPSTFAPPSIVNEAEYPRPSCVLSSGRTLVLRRAGKDEALRRVHAEFIAAGATRANANRPFSVVVSCRDEAPCAVHQVHLDAGKPLSLRLPHAVAVS